LARADGRALTVTGVLAIIALRLERFRPGRLKWKDKAG